MIFYSVPFLLMFVCLLFCLYKVKNNKIQHILLLSANFIFYAYWNKGLFALICFEIVIVYLFSIKVSKNKSRIFVVIPTIVIIGLLCYFKYLNFFVNSFCIMFGVTNNLTINIILPLGISFYSFQALSYIFDVYYGKVELEKDILKLAVYISFFPQITSGPIVKSKDFLKQLDYVHIITKTNIYEGMQIFLIGFIKKKVFADRIGVCVNSVFEAPMAYQGISVLVAIIGYAIQIYCDFSGYSDMAIGIAKMMGFDLGKNFNLPYLSENLSEFWKRWHISLSSWFRDYLYIPLGGNRKGELKTYFNLFITMLVSGLWHGAALTYIVWGVLHGVGCIVNKIWHDMFGEKSNKVSYKIKNIIITNIFVILLWIVFRANNLSHSLMIIKSLFNIKGILYINIYVIIYTFIIVSIHVWFAKSNNGNSKYIILDLNKISSKIIFVLVIFSAIALMYVGDSAFIYAQF